MAGELGREMVGGARIGGEVGEHGEPLRLALLRIGAADDLARARLVDRLGEMEIAGAAGAAEQPLHRAAGEAVDGPAGQHAREFGDVGLAVAAVHAERVQLQDLAREILVEPAALAGEALRRAGRRANSGPIDWA